MSELGAFCWEDVIVETKDGERFPNLGIKQSKTDALRDGIVRSLVEVDSCLRPVKTFPLWKEMSCDSGNETSNVFVAQLRNRLSGIMKTAALANGVFDSRIDTHSLRAGGATAIYTQGVPLGVIQRWGRWKSLTPHQYLRRDDSALNHLSEIVVRSHGLLECLKLMIKNVKQTRFQDIVTMADKDASIPPKSATLEAAQFLPNGRFRAGGGFNSQSDYSDDLPFSPSDFPPYTASPDGTMQGTRPLTKREKQEKKEKEDSDPNDVNTTKV